MKRIGLLLVVGLIAMGCSKDQKIVKKLADGKWKVTAMTIDGESQPDSTFENETYEFEKCKVSKEDCNGTYTYEDPDKGTQTSSFTYSISEKGTKMTVNMEIFGFSTSTTSDIIEHTDSKFVWSNTTDGTTVETTIEKI